MRPGVGTGRLGEISGAADDVWYEAEYLQVEALLSKTRLVMGSTTE